MRFSEKKAVILKVNCKNPPESSLDLQKQYVRFLK